MFLVGKFKEVDGERFMVLNEAITFVNSDLKNAIDYADTIGNAYVAMIKDGYIPILVYDTDAED